MGGTQQKPEKKPTQARHSPEHIKMMIAKRREAIASGKITAGRQKGALNKATIASIVNGETFKAELSKQLGHVANDLLRNSKKGDTQASKIIVEQAVGKPVENKNLHITVFDIYKLAQLRGTVPTPVDGNADAVILDAPEILDDAT